MAGLMIISIAIALIYCFSPSMQYDGADCEDPRKASSTCENKTDSVHRWYYNKKLFKCLAYNDTGCVTGNSFRTIKECYGSPCVELDGPTCSGGFPPYSPEKGVAPLKADNCTELKCPAGWQCVKGVLFASCCNTITEGYFADAFNPGCPVTDGGPKRVPSPPVEDSNTFLPSVYVAERCRDLICPETHPCRQINPIFAKCCQASTNVSAAAAKS